MAQKRKKIKVPLQSTRAVVDSNSYNVEDNTIEVVFATETPVRRYNYSEGSYFNEVLQISKRAVDMIRLDNGASVLDNHNLYAGVEKVLGVVLEAWVDETKKEARARIKLSEEEADAAIINKVKKGIIRNISCLYSISEYTVTDEDGEIPTLTATRWQPSEISFVPVPADYMSGTRSQENQQITEATIINSNSKNNSMTEEEKRALEAQKRTADTELEKQKAESEKQKMVSQPPVNESEVRAAAIQDERKRVAAITDSCKRAGLPAEFAEGLVNDGKNINEAREAIIDEVAKRANPAPTGHGITVTGEDETEKTRNAIVTGLMARAIPGSVKTEDNEKAQRYRNMRMLDLAKDRLRAKGEKFDLLSEQEIVKRAWATTDFPKLLTSTFNRTLRRFYEGTVDEWKFIARQESVTDFREKTGLKVDGAVTFEEIPEDGEYRQTPILDVSESKIKLKKYGRKYSISDIAIINDDLSVFSRLPQIMAIGAQQFQSDAVWANVINNAKAPDGTALFASGHKNLASTGATMSETTLSAARTAMRRQKTSKGNKLNIRPKYLLVPPELETAAEKLVSSVLAGNTGDVNVFAGKLQVVVSDQLTDKKAWYLVADPAAITADGIVYAYLNGQPGLKTESRVNFDTDALEVKGSMAFATAVWGWEGWYKNPGA